MRPGLEIHFLGWPSGLCDPSAAASSLPTLDGFRV